MPCQHCNVLISRLQMHICDRRQRRMQLINTWITMSESAKKLRRHQYMTVLRQNIKYAIAQNILIVSRNSDAFIQCHYCLSLIAQRNDVKHVKKCRLKSVQFICWLCHRRDGHQLNPFFANASILRDHIQKHHVLPQLNAVINGNADTYDNADTNGNADTYDNTDTNENADTNGNKIKWTPNLLARERIYGTRDDLFFSNKI